MPNIKQDKFVVLKRDDIKKHLNETDLKYLHFICHKIGIKRELEGKKNYNHYWVVNKDECYADQIEKLVLNGGENA